MNLAARTGFIVQHSKKTEYIFFNMTLNKYIIAPWLLCSFHDQLDFTG